MRNEGHLTVGKKLTSISGLSVRANLSLITTKMEKEGDERQEALESF